MTGSLKITKLKFKSGSNPDQQGLEISPGKVTIIVGPNNSGKSTLLKEIEDFYHVKNNQRLILEDLDFHLPETPDEGEKLLTTLESKTRGGEGMSAGGIYVDKYQIDSSIKVRRGIHKYMIREQVEKKDKQNLIANLGALYILRLDIKTVFSLLEPQKIDNDPPNHLFKLFNDDTARKTMRELTFEAFKRYFVIDIFDGKYRIKLSPKEPNCEEEKGMNEVSKSFYSKAMPIEKTGNGTQIYIAIISAVIGLPNKVILLDEPDISLAPGIARLLGRNVVKSCNRDGREASLVIATHSSDFLYGCLEQAANDTTIVRLAYDFGKPSARALEPTELIQMIKDPLMRSMNVLKALFHKAAVITEGEKDRVLYDSTNHLLVNKGTGIDDVLFLSAGGNESVYRLVQPLRIIGIPTPALVDLDTINNENNNWDELLTSCNIPAKEKEQLELERNFFALLFSKINIANQPKVIKRGGIFKLDSKDRTRAEAFLSTLSKYGLFLVPNGDLESWFPQLSINVSGSIWLSKALDLLNPLYRDPKYESQEECNIFKFIEAITKWINDPTRSGMT